MNKNLIIFIPSIEDGGVEKNLYIISNYLIKQNIKIEILTCNCNKKKNFHKNIDFIGTKSSFWFNKSRNIKYIICLLYLFIYLLKNRTKKLVFAFQANIYAILITKLTKTKVITRSNSSPSGWSKNPIKRIIYYLGIRLADDVMVNSYEFKKEFKKIFNINPKCILNPFDETYFYKKKFKLNKKKKNSESLNIISIGRLTNQKDHLTLLKAAKLINPNLNPVVTIIGKGQNYFMLKNFIKNNNLFSTVKLVGYHPKPYIFFNKADIFVLTSMYEGLPNVLLEAQFFKKYIISTNCPTGPKEILLNGQAGDLINIGDYKNLSKLINSYMKRKKQISAMIKNGTKNFKRYDYSINCKKYLKFVNQNF